MASRGWRRCQANRLLYTPHSTLSLRDPLSRPAKSVRESHHESSELMMPQHANNMGHVFGGVILSMMDKCAAIAAFRHSRASVVTASIDRVDFREQIGRASCRERV